VSTRTLSASEVEHRLATRPYPPDCSICHGSGVYINSRGGISDQPCDIFTGGCQAERRSH
jgi:hypothetical protein